MRKILFKIILILLPLVISVADLHATKYPMIPFYVSGKVVDWNTKEPLENVNLIIFLNDAVYADNHGWLKDAQDFPNFPRSDKDGNFTGRTRLYRGGPEIKIQKVEIISFREGYRMERFIISNPKFTIASDKLSGTIEIKTIELLKNQSE